MLWLLRRNGYESAIRSGVTWVRLRCIRNQGGDSCATYLDFCAGVRWV